MSIFLLNAIFWHFQMESFDDKIYAKYANYI